MHKQPDMGPIYCKGQADIPKQKHWAIFETEHVTEEGRDRGDPSNTVHYVQYIAYLDKALWEAEIIKRTKSAAEDRRYEPTPFVAAEMNPVTISVKVDVTINN